jgi:DNA-binding NtrC family response regulator
LHEKHPAHFSTADRLIDEPPIQQVQENSREKMANLRIVDLDPDSPAAPDSGLADHLRRRGHAVAEMDSDLAALQASRGERPDLTLLRLGSQLDPPSRRLRALVAPAAGPTVVLSNRRQASEVLAALELGAVDVLPSDLGGAEVCDALERTLSLHRAEALQQTLSADGSWRRDTMIGNSPRLHEVRAKIAKVAPLDVTVLLSGESGTGKELAARSLHRQSRRRNGPLVAVNCGAIPATLAEAEFFGYEKGAFTDARHAHAGAFERAEGGTLFLDEIGELPPESQAKLLRAIQDRSVQRLGGRSPRPVDFRLVAATNRDLRRAVEAGQFRDDLYWRLAVVEIAIPALRERREDLPLLISYLVDRFNRELRLNVRTLSPAALRCLTAYHWPGNVRELENTLCQAMAWSDGTQVQEHDLPERLRPSAAPAADRLTESTLTSAVQAAVERIEKTMILTALAKHDGRRGEAAKTLGVSRRTLFSKMQAHGIS